MKIFKVENKNWNINVHKNNSEIMIALYCSIIVVKHAITTLISETMYFDIVLLKTNRFIIHEQYKHYIYKYILINESVSS